MSSSLTSHFLYGRGLPEIMHAIFTVSPTYAIMFLLPNRAAGFSGIPFYSGQLSDYKILTKKFHSFFFSFLFSLCPLILELLYRIILLSLCMHFFVNHYGFYIFFCLESFSRFYLYIYNIKLFKIKTSYRLFSSRP